ncbi:NSFL1 cofactor p47 [Eumeta japonica]|uniref:NSFL1 cofactor p47 n=1 Tax=Eumeta variegata TaxID=151549 RepID=A0A4C1WIY5_EUMVA|nr:NSFL1 cofactor p47 [Eumeta japonica]
MSSLIFPSAIIWRLGYPAKAMQRVKYIEVRVMGIEIGGLPKLCDIVPGASHVDVTKLSEPQGTLGSTMRIVTNIPRLVLKLVALSNFYEHGGNIESAQPGSQSSEPRSILLSDSEGESPPTSPVKPIKEKKPKRNTNPKFGTIDSLHQESSSDEEEGQAFYAGGSERSGQQILDPGKGRKDIVTEMFKSVRERGAVAFDDDPGSTSRRQPSAFTGVGYRLGQTSDDHEQVTPSSAREQDQVHSVRLRLYREGFTVDDGALRLYSDTNNAEFLACIRRGEIPPELSEAAGGGGAEVRVSLEDRRHEPCPRQPTKQRAFAGKGHLLGSPTPPTVGATAPVAADASDRAANERAAQDAVRLDESQPVTAVQFRLADGSRLTGRFNHTHTVSHLRQYIVTAVPAYQLQEFILMTTFPSVELTDDSATLAEAKLLNSVVVQRVK